MPLPRKPLITFIFSFTGKNLKTKKIENTFGIMDNWHGIKFRIPFFRRIRSYPAWQTNICLSETKKQTTIAIGKKKLAKIISTW